MSQLRFSDGIETLEHLRGAVRVVDNSVIASYGEEFDLPYIEEGIRDVQYEIETDNQLLIVISPIVEDGGILGYDVMKFDLEPVMSQISFDKSNARLLTKEERQELIDKAGEHLEIEGHTVVLNKNFIDHMDEIRSTSVYLLVSVDSEEVFSSVDKASRNSIISFVVLGIIFMSISNIITANLAGVRITNLEEQRDEYKTKSIIDPLTGAYSRRVLLDSGDQDLIPDHFVGMAVMLDLTDFKSINDNYGHQEGDKVLRKLVDVMKKSLRENDYIIRYGGDEFLVLLGDCDYQEGKTIIDRIRDEFSRMSDSGYDLDFAYGMKRFDGMNELDKVIRIADDRMYKEKSR